MEIESQKNENWVGFAGNAAAALRIVADVSSLYRTEYVVVPLIFVTLTYIDRVAPLPVPLSGSYNIIS